VKGDIKKLKKKMGNDLLKEGLSIVSGILSGHSIKIILPALNIG
jgi:hypothetical protein